MSSNKHPLICLVLAVLGTQINAQDLEWVKQIGSPSADRVIGMCTDPAGNVYVTGALGGSTGMIDGNSFPVIGPSDIFLAKFSSAGTYEWAIVTGGEIWPPDPGFDSEAGVHVQYNPVSNNMVLVGGFATNTSPVVFGPGLSLFGNAAFIASYDLDWSCNWLQTAPDAPWDMMIDDAGFIYVQGSWSGIYPDNYYMMKFSAAGDSIWYKDIGEKIQADWVADEDGTLVMAYAAYQGCEILGNTISQTAYSDALIARIDSSADQLLGYVQFPSDSLARFCDIEILQDGTFIVSGGYREDLMLPSDTLVAPNGFSQVVLARLDSSGAPLWVREIEASGNISSCIPTTLAGDSTIYVGFDASFPTSFGPFAFTPSTDADFVVARYDLDGNCLGIIQSGELSSGTIELQGTDDGGIIVAGPFTGTMNLDTGLTGMGNTDYFVAKFGPVTGIHTLNAGFYEALRIYANPNNGTCTIDLPADLEFTRDLVLNIYDPQGNLVQSEAVGRNSGQMTLDIRAHAKGSYPVEITDGEQRYTGTIVFE